MYRLITIILIMIPAIYSMQKEEIKSELRREMEKKGMNLREEFLTEVCDEIGNLCPEAYTNQPSAKCDIDTLFEHPQGNVILKIKITHQVEQYKSCTFWYNLETNDLKMEGNSAFDWKMYYNQE